MRLLHLLTQRKVIENYFIDHRLSKFYKCGMVFKFDSFEKLFLELIDK